MPDYFCYILKNRYSKDINRTYNGFTTNPKRRIRQHNQEIKGGARYTKAFGNKTWEVYVLIKGFPNEINALQCEWRIKHPENKRRTSLYCSPKGRVIGLNKVLKLDKWTNNSTIDNNTINLKLWIVEDYAYLLKDLPDNIDINIVEKIDIDNI